MSQAIVPIGGAWLDSRIPAIAKRLQERDPRLELQARCNTSREVLAYELLWTGPDGKRSVICHWRPSEVEQIEHDVAMMDRNAPGHIPTIERIDRHNSGIEQAALDKFRDVYGEMLEHGARLARDLSDGRHFHGQAGFGEGKLGKK